ncbi:hypothetical protein MKW92_029071 [Papaver armeniacum]|nr:hypothetical protein MKW92_029071 [Papaver armeniacum]
MENKDDQPSSSRTSYRRQRVEQDSNQSNQRPRVDETSATEDNNNNNSSSSRMSQENLEWFMGRDLQMVGQMDRQSRIYMFEAGQFQNEDGSSDGSIPDIVRLQLLNSNVGTTDGMSYEELTELGDRIGKVERGLPKEFISSHLRTRVHTTTGDSTGEEETEICTVCQDGYENKDKIATLDCKHEYHEDCITQWLLQKNVCPVCKRQALKAQGPKAMEELHCA